MRAHRALLLRGAHDNVWLQRTWDRDGAGAFRFQLRERCTQDMLRDREADVLDDLGPDDVFNLSPVVRKGARATNASVPNTDVLEIYMRAGAGASVAALASEFRYPKETVRRIVFGRTYKAVTGGKPARPPIRARGVNCGPQGRGFTPDGVRDARRSHAQGESMSSIARRLGVNPRTVKLAILRETWGHVR